MSTPLSSLSMLVRLGLQGRSYDLDSGQVKIFARVAREKFLGL